MTKPITCISGEFCLNVVDPPALGQLGFQPLDPAARHGQRPRRRVRLRSRCPLKPAAPSRAACNCHLWINVEYKASRRSNAPRSPRGAASYSAKIRFLYAAVNVRAFALTATCGSGKSSTRPANATPAEPLESNDIRQPSSTPPKQTDQTCNAVSHEVDTEGRVRGEHFHTAEGFYATLGSSPRSRGAPSWMRTRGRHLGIIPAFAGST